MNELKSCFLKSNEGDEEESVRREKKSTINSFANTSYYIKDHIYSVL